ncbi:M48 family metalloprotease [Desulfococcaceae bacterium HSG9]|nr:M48 family metalloprotease [Desulfococcaceae bacterium HSG9]
MLFLKLKKNLACIAIFIFLTGLMAPPDAASISTKEEEKLAKEFLTAVKKHLQLIDDPIIVNYLNTVGQRLVKVFPSMPFEFHFYMVQDDTYNAFAGPAGHIFMHSGLFLAMESEEELAGIIGHEIAHVTSRHISDRIERSTKIGAATIAGVAAGILLGAAGAGKVASAVTLGSVAAGQSSVLAYSREDEIQADQVGLIYLDKAGYNGKGLLSALKKIRSREWFGSEQIPTYLKTHPASEERIAYIGSWLASNAEKTKNSESSSVNPYNFERAHLRLTTLYGDPDTVLKDLQARLKKNPSDSMAHYSYGVLLSKTGDRQEAIIHFKKALEQNAFDPNILTELSRSYFLDGRNQEALNTLEGALSIAPQDPEARLLMADIQISLANRTEAIEILQKLVVQNPEHVRALYLLGNTYGKQGQLGLAHYYLGKYYKADGQIRNAVFQFQKALKLIKDSDKEKEIKVILKDLKKPVKRKS